MPSARVNRATSHRDPRRARVQNHVLSPISAKEKAASAASRPRKARVGAILIAPILPNQKDRHGNDARGIVPRATVPSVTELRVIVPRVIVLSATVPRATALSVNAVRAIGLVARVLHGMVHSAIKENSVVGLQTAGVQGRIVLGQRLSLVRGIASRK